MPTYQIRLHLYKIDAASPKEAKDKVCEIIGKSPNSFISVGLFEDRRKFWQKLLFGPK